MSATSQTVTVDGQIFRVSWQLGTHSRYDFRWLTGPHDYGFTASYSSSEPMTPADVEDAIRGFLAQIDPETGFID
ncbi:hypothetical protein Ae406Ps2_2886c [Pseudonocardia sp. Ae406_Ps2]|uniref:hypothetical protein n=1 Tax=unclassified Pseudonocardia TaxID=2619320 RepID=UPI00094B2AC6|nr:MULTISPECIES: hypothetical protein [unclassified Pseudonocardia]OLL99373.1 hypothetical protein Ae331Ps2_3040 [Pseudonocardia sp. Ae331_Ps2]OLM02886.1 hypothetical protein Ae406Ps2_2886c [Pseudonocardia sp. Ae406_Ps2]OLM12264.1 hypothetical protein Ae505Ps2_2391 [Pseudonocardia sp. Ae505_Ps2]OLM24464.1 hypothetical protein Ae706Ps2_2897c [Pseudonocardia sp. Ae706_Ps2]OLM29604.1 hypothetical protein Ae717Ps2_0497 [Pseudonocardia sp. Ae717_Ps2]